MAGLRNDITWGFSGNVEDSRTKAVNYTELEIF